MMRLLSVSTCLFLFLCSLTRARRLVYTSTCKVARFGLSGPLDSSYRWNSLSPKHSLYSTSTISVRGGNVEPTTTTKTSNTIKTFSQKISPYWSSFCKLVEEKTKLVQEKVQPALDDPRTNLWDPFQSFVSKQTQVAKERQEIVVHQDPKQAASLLINPGRFLKLSIAAWIVAEVLYKFGFFDNPAGVGKTLQQVWKEHAEEPLEEVQYHVKKWWQGERGKGGFLHPSTYRDLSLLFQRIQNFAPRYQFALGACIGMAVSPIVWCLAIKAIQATVIVYVLSEVNEYWRDNSSVGDSLIEVLGFRGKGGDSINDFLDHVREGIRSTVLYPDKFWADTRESLQEDSVDGPPANTKQGFVFGTIIGVIV